MTSITRQDLIDFIVEEAHLLDTRQFDAWNALFTPEAIYWLPLSADQTDGVNHASLMHEDALLRGLRIDRLKNPRAHSQQPPSRCQHVLQAPVIERFEPEAHRFTTRTAFHYAEAQAGDVQVLVGTARHELVVQGGALKIAHKRVDLLNADAPLRAIQLFI